MEEDLESPFLEEDNSVGTNEQEKDLPVDNPFLVDDNEEQSVPSETEQTPVEPVQDQRIQPLVDNQTFSNILGEAGEAAFNPLSKGLEVANQVPYVQDIVPDWMVSATESNRDIAGGVAGGLYSAARNTAQLGADIIDYQIPGTSTPVSDALSIAPKFEGKNTLQNVSSDITEITSGFLLGNKAGAAAKTMGYAPKVISAIESTVPKLAGKLGVVLWDIAKSGSQGILGMAATTEPGSSNLVVGDNSVVKNLGLGTWIEGLPTDSPDAAKNALIARVNTGLDAFLTGAGASTIFKGIRGLHESFLEPTITSKIAPVFSHDERIRSIFSRMGEELQKIKGVETPEQIRAAWQRLVEMVGNVDAQTLKGRTGIAGVDDVAVPLDVATTVGRQVSQRSSDLDKGIQTTLNSLAKKITQKGYEATALRREAPIQTVGDILEQTGEAVGGKDIAKTGAKTVQDLGQKAVLAGKIEGEAARDTAIKTADTIVEKINLADDLKSTQLSELFNKVPDTAKIDTKAFNKNLKSNWKELPKEIKDLVKSVAEEHQGSFKSLNNILRPKINEYIGLLKTSTNIVDRDSVSALRNLRDHIDNAQVSYLRTSGYSDVADAAEKAMDYYKKEVAPFRQGTTGNIVDITKSSGFKEDEMIEKTRKELEKVLNDPEYPQYNARIKQLLESDEGGRSSDLITKWQNSRDKQKLLENIENDVYGDKLREFFDPRSRVPLPMGYKSFEEALEDPQSLDRIKYMVDLAEKEGDESVQKALQYSYVRFLRERLGTGNLTELGSERTSLKGLRSILNDESLEAVSKEIFKKTPEFTETVKDILTLAHDIQKSNILRAAPASWTDQIPAKAKDALKKVLNPIYGPLSHRALQINTLWGTLLEVMGPQGAIDRTMDALLSDPELFLKAYKELGSPKPNKKQIETATKVLMNSLLHTNGEREQFNKINKEWQDDLQTEEIFGEPKGEFKGMIQKGNIDLSKRPKVKNSDGSISTIRSVSYNIDGKEVLIPTVVDGKVVSDKEALEHYKKTGEHLGKFDTPEHANAYAKVLHEAQEDYYN